MNTKRSHSRTGTDFGSWLLSQVRQRGMTQNEFADKLGVSKSTISRWANGDIPKARYIEQIADVLVVEYDIVATMAGIRPKELMEIDPDSATARLMPLIEEIDWEARPGRLEGLEFELRQMIEWDRMQKASTN